MNRRTFVTGLGAVLAAPMTVGAQQKSSARNIRIGILINEPSSAIDGLRDGLRDVGYVEDRDFVFAYALAGPHSERFPSLASDLVRSKVDFVVTWGTPAAAAAKNATSTIPIIMGAIGDPLSVGIVSSLARPGGNITGLSSLAVDLEAKRLELLKQLVPRLSRVAVLWHRDNPSLVFSSKTATAAGERLGVTLRFVSVTDAPTLAGVLNRVNEDGAEALLVMAEPSLIAKGSEITAFALKNRLPAVYPFPEHAQAGGLLTYATSYYDLFRRASTFVDRIVKGARPGDLPIEQPTKFDLIINMKTAKGLGITIPPELLLRADQIIE
jgi:putative ABC transport system substrate-binding protein